MAEKLEANRIENSWPRSLTVFALAWLILSVSVYTVVLGDSGMIRKGQLKAELKELEATVEDLKRENAVLNESYYLEREKEKSERKGSTIILKFEQDQLRKSRPVKMRGLSEFRLIYWFASVFIGLVIVTILLSTREEGLNSIIKRKFTKLLTRSKNYE